MPPNGTADPNVGEGAQGQNQGDGGNWREENTKLRQELAEMKALQSKAMPWVNVAVELQKQQPEVFEKLAKGEPLTKAESKVVAAAQSADADAEPLTKGEFKKLMQENLGEMLQQMNANRQAEKAMDDLDGWARKELDGYANVRNTRVWGGYLSAVLGAIENGTMEVPEDVKDPYKFAVQATYDLLKLKHPDLLKGPKRGQSEEDRAAELLAGGRKPPSSKTLDQEEPLPDEIQKELDFIASIGQGQGKKFSP